MKPNFISEQRIIENVSLSEVLPVVEQAFLDYQNGKISIGQRSIMPVRPPDNNSLFLPSVHHNVPYYAIKHASSFPSNPVRGLPTVMSQISIYDAQTGNLLAVIEANQLTALKTGAAAAVAAKYLAREESQVGLIIGAGEQAKLQLAALLAVRHLQEVWVVDRDQHRTDAFCRWAIDTLAEAPPIIAPAKDGQTAARADIIVTCTTSKLPVLQGADLKPGVHINAIGSFTPDMQEIDSDTVARADLIVTDQIEETWLNAGDLLTPFHEGRIDRQAISAELGEIVSGHKPGRMNAEQITIYESIGFAALDLAVAIMVNEKINRH